MKTEVQGTFISKYVSHSLTHLLKLNFRLSEEFPDSKVKKEMRLIVRFLLPQRGKPEYLQQSLPPCVRIYARIC